MSLTVNVLLGLLEYYNFETYAGLALRSCVSSPANVKVVHHNCPSAMQVVRSR